MSGLTTLRSDLCNVLRYAQELVSLKDRAVLDIASEPHPAFYEAGMQGLEGIDLTPDPENWMRLRRLRESQPPTPDPIFKGWTKDAPHPSPDAPPSLLDHRMLRLPI